MKVNWIAFFLCSMFVVHPVQAKLYKWIDSSGKIQYSDTPPAEIKSPVTVLSNQGTERDRIETAAERSARQAREKAMLEEAERRRIQEAKDSALLTTYTGGIKQIEQQKQEALAPFK